MWFGIRSTPGAPAHGSFPLLLTPSLTSLWDTLGTERRPDSRLLGSRPQRLPAQNLPSDGERVLVMSWLEE